MSNTSILFSSHRKPSAALSIERPDEIIQETLAFVGGTIYVKGGVQIDAKLKNVSVVSLDGNPVVLSALGIMDNCAIDAMDVLICGDFTGEVRAKGDCEIAPTAKARGLVLVRGHALISPLAGDSDEIRVGRLPNEVVTEVPFSEHAPVDDPRHSNVSDVTARD
jgi:cytoskeletal protein CcmA (bactofilin family)